MASKTPKRPQARKAAAAAESTGKPTARRTDVIARESARLRSSGASGKPVKLLKDPSKMTAADRVRYFLGLPQGYPVNQGHSDKIQSRLAARFVSREPAHGYMEREGEQVRRLRDAPLPQLDKALWDFGMWKPGEMAGTVPVKGHGEGSQEAYLTPFEMLLMEDVIQDELPGARARGETVGQARATARQEAAKPQNPRMGGPKRKHGGY
jgi:hypothetical protein